MNDIPEEAIEAAMEALHDRMDCHPGGESYICECDGEQIEGDARAALEAAMPHLNPVRTVTSIEELKALPADTVLRGRDDELWERGNILGEPCMWAHGWVTFENAVKHGAPFTVLHVPGS